MAVVVIVGVGMTVLVEMVVGMGMLVGVVMAVRMRMGVGNTVVGVLVRMFVGMLVGVIAAANMIVVDMHSRSLLLLFFLL